jgi:hypothetical protein
MTAPHLHAVEPATRVATQDEIRAWVAERRRVLAELLEAADIERQAA